MRWWLIVFFLFSVLTFNTKINFWWEWGDFPFLYSPQNNTNLKDISRRHREYNEDWDSSFLCVCSCNTDFYHTGERRWAMKFFSPFPRNCIRTEESYILMFLLIFIIASSSFFPVALRLLKFLSDSLHEPSLTSSSLFGKIYASPVTNTAVWSFTTVIQKGIVWLESTTVYVFPRLFKFAPGEGSSETHKKFSSFLCTRTDSVVPYILFIYIVHAMVILLLNDFLSL